MVGLLILLFPVLILIVPGTGAFFIWHACRTGFSEFGTRLCRYWRHNLSEAMLRLFYRPFLQSQFHEQFFYAFDTLEACDAGHTK